MNNSLKIFYGEEVRRIPFPAPKPTWQQFQMLLRTLFSNNYHPEIRISYQDEEGDQITMSSEIEWNSAYDFLSTQSLPKITLKVPEYPFSEGPPPQPLYFYVHNADQQPCQTIPVNSTKELEHISKNLSACLEKLLPEGKLLPNNLPDWFRPAVKVRRSQNPSEVDLDLDIDKLANILHSRAISELDIHNTDSARNSLQALYCISPKNPITLYNMACCEALANQKALALEFLGQAISNGYTKLEHMMTDSDLEAIRETPEFKKLAQDLHFSQLHSKVTNLKI